MTGVMAALQPASSRWTGAAEAGVAGVLLTRRAAEVDPGAAVDGVVAGTGERADPAHHRDTHPGGIAGVTAGAGAGRIVDAGQ